MAEVTKLMYIVVVDDEKKKEEKKVSFRYTRPVLQSTLQLMGCKARHAFKISKRVFELMRSECSGDASLSAGKVISVSAGAVMSEPDASKGDPQKGKDRDTVNGLDKPYGGDHLGSDLDGTSDSKPYELYKKRTTVVVGRKTFLDVVSSALDEYKYVGPNQRTDLALACRCITTAVGRLQSHQMEFFP